MTEDSLAWNLFLLLFLLLIFPIGSCFIVVCLGRFPFDDLHFYQYSALPVQIA